MQKMEHKSIAQCWHNTCIPCEIVFERNYGYGKNKGKASCFIYSTATNFFKACIFKDSRFLASIKYTIRGFAPRERERSSRMSIGTFLS